MTYSWLVENFTKEGQSTGLYMLCLVNMTVTADVNAARKFRLQRTAEFLAADMRDAYKALYPGPDGPADTIREAKVNRMMRRAINSAARAA